MKHEKDCALEIREVNGQLEMYVHTDLTLWVDYRPLEELKGVKILNPIDGLKLITDRSKNWAYIDRDDVEIMWCNAKGETGMAFNDVALQNDEEYDAWFVGKIIVEKISNISHSPIGSSHWFNTLVSEHSRIGEYLKLNSGEISPTLLNGWGERLYNSSRELLEWGRKSKTLTKIP